MVNMNELPIVQYFNDAKDWTINFFQNLDQNESIGVGIVALGLILVITGLILL